MLLIKPDPICEGMYYEIFYLNILAAIAVFFAIKITK